MEGNFYEKAAAGGHLDILLWLKANNCKFDKSEKTYMSAVRSDNIEIVPIGVPLLNMFSVNVCFQRISICFNGCKIT